MQISRESETALRLLCLLGNNDGKYEKNNLFSKLRTDEKTFEKICQILSEKGIITISEEVIVLRRKASDISILNVIDIFDDSSRISFYLANNELTFEDEYDVQIHKIHAYVQKGISMCYGEVTVATIIERINKKKKRG